MADTGVFPGTFNPPTIAHLEIVRAACVEYRLDALVMAISRAGADKKTPDRPTLDERVEVVGESLAELASDVAAQLSCQVTEHQLLVDIAEHFDAGLLIVGADKWHQLRELRFYENDPDLMADALERLPPLAVAPRDGWDVPVETRLEVAEWVGGVSSTEARKGRRELMTGPARRLDRATSCWSGA